MTKKTVLIVEDNEMNMKLFVDILEIHGYKTVGTNDGAKALEVALEHRPDIILMDIQLPGMDGKQATRMIKANENLANTPVIAVTACTMKGDEDSFRSCGCSDYISKPFSLTNLIEIVEKYTQEELEK